MNFDLDENQSLFKATVERFCTGQDVAARHRTRTLPAGFDRARWQELAALGIIGIAAGEADGGLDGSLLDCATVAQALGHAQATEPWLECGFLPARILAGTPDCAAIVTGDRLATLAFAEPERRFELDGCTVQARPVGDGHILSGTKHFVLSGAAADLFLVTAATPSGTALFAVPRDAAGVDAKPYPIVDGSLAIVLTLREVAVGPALPCDAEQLRNAVTDTRLMAAAEMLGLAQRLFADTLAYVKTREQFGQPIGRFQIIQHRMVDCYSRVEQMQSSLWRGLLVTGGDRHRAARGLKAFVADSAIAVAQEAVQLHGGMGMTDELGIGHGLKRLQLLSKLFGDTASDIATYAKAA